MKPLLWLLLVAGGTLLGVFALIGVLYSFRGTPVSHVRGVGGEPARLSVSDPVFRRTVEMLSETQLRDCNEVEILLNGDETFPRIWSDLRAARHSITLRLYYFLPGEVADSLRSVLIDRARAGVPVYFLYDAVGGDLPETYVASLRAAGVRIRPYRPLRWSSLNIVQNRSHVRSIVIDGRVGYTGGFGIDEKWLGNGRRKDQWRETNVRFSGPAVMQLQAAFAVGWGESSGTLLTGTQLFPPWGFQCAGGTPAGILYTTPAVGSTEAERFLALSIRGATRSLLITNSYFVPDDDLRRALKAAARRGVDVRILTAGRETDVRSVRWAARDRYEELLRAGVRIYEYQPTLVHAKTMVVDGVWSTVGTMNFDNRSAAINEESNLVLFDPVVGRRLVSIFQDDLRFAREIRLAEFRRRPWWERVMENASSLLTRVL